MDYRVLVFDDGLLIMVKSLNSGVDVLEFIGAMYDQGLDAKLL